jgi:hypothetical protein
MATSFDEGYNEDELIHSPLQATFGNLAGTSKDAVFVSKMSSVKDTEGRFVTLQDLQTV